MNTQKNLNAKKKELKGMVFFMQSDSFFALSKEKRMAFLDKRINLSVEITQIKNNLKA